MEKKGISNASKNVNIINSHTKNENEDEKNINNMNYNNIDNNENEIQNDSYLDIPEVKEASLQSEITNFNEIFTNIKQYYTKSPDKLNKFCEEFQNFLKNKIDFINNMINLNISNLLYSLNVYHSKIEIYSFLNKKINSILKEITNVNKFNNSGILLVSLDKIEEHRSENEYIINKIINEMNNSSSIGNLMDLKKENKQLNIEIENLNNELNEIKKEKKDNELLIKNLKNENKNLQEMNKLLKKDNDKITGNLFKKADQLIKTTNEQKQDNYKETKMDEEEDEKSNFDIKSLFENNNEKIILGPTRILAKNFLLEIINDIYKTKAYSDSKNLQNHYPRYTLEQHLFNYLKAKYGLKKLVIEWTINIYNGIKLYSKENGEICLFGLLLRNELDENSIQILNKIKESVKKLIKEFIENENKYEGIINNHIYLDENLWKNLSYILFNNNPKLSEKFIRKIEEYIEMKVNNMEVINHIGKKILYKDYLNLLITYNVHLRRKYLSNLVEIFRKVDEGKHGLITDSGFKEIIQRIEVYNPNEIEEKSDYLIELIDNYGHNQIRFSDVVDIFDNEIIFDNDTGEKIKVLDKIASRI